jgi:hypothetical protein
MKEFARKHWKTAALTAATGAAMYYGGPAAAAKVQELLPALLAAFGG